jgi:uncharacterized membrane protein YhaH (DUF805 family)
MHHSRGLIVGFVEAIKTGFKKTFVYQGRASLAEFWWFQLFHALSLIGLFILSAMIIFLLAPGRDNPNSVNPIVVLMVSILFLYALGMLLPSLSLAVRRLHDSDKSGAFLLLIFVPFGGLVLLVLYCLSGTRGPNKHGDDPLRPETTAALVF